MQLIIMPAQSKTGELDHLKQRISDLEDRMTQMEKLTATPEVQRRGRFLYQESAVNQNIQEEPGNIEGTSEESMESRVGEYGMAWMGNVVLLFGILFLSQFLQKNNQESISLVFGFVSVALVYLMGFLSRNSLPYMSRLFSYNGHLLLYIQAMRICLFPGSRIIDNSFLGYAVVLVILISLIYLAYRKSSQVLAIIVWVMLVITALVDGSLSLIHI